MEIQATNFKYKKVLIIFTEYEENNNLVNHKKDKKQHDLTLSNCLKESSGQMHTQSLKS